MGLSVRDQMFTSPPGNPTIVERRAVDVGLVVVELHQRADIGGEIIAGARANVPAGIELGARSSYRLRKSASHVERKLGRLLGEDRPCEQ